MLNKSGQIVYMKFKEALPFRNAFPIHNGTIKIYVWEKFIELFLFIYLKILIFKFGLQSKLLADLLNNEKIKEQVKIQHVLRLKNNLICSSFFPFRCSKNGCSLFT